MKKSWKQQSFEVIDKIFNSITREQPHLSPAEVLRLVSLHYYPFGKRNNHPYKAWLGAMKDYKKRFGLIVPRKKDIKTPLFSNFDN